MSSVDIEKLLEPVSPEQPCGENLEYDADFGELERAAQPKPEQEYGNTKVEAEEPNWRDVRDRAIELFPRTKDLRVATYLARAALRSDGLAGFRDSLAVVRALLERYWQDVHPNLDPDDDLDPALRVNTLATLNDGEACLRPLLEAPLLESSLGRTTFRDYLIALGEMPPRGGQEPIEVSTIESAFTDADGDAVLAMAAAVKGAAEDAVAIESAVTEQVGVQRTVSLDAVCDMLRRMSKLLDEQVERRGLGAPPEEAIVDEAGSSDSNGEDSSGELDDSGEPAVSRQPAFDSVQSRDDVIRLLDKICEYYRQQEPSSPVPLLLRRAKRVATMDFLELLRELAPGGLPEAEVLKGTAEADSGS